MDKEELRKKYIDIRKKVEDRVRKSNSICQKVLETEEFKKAKIIACYMSLPTEVDTKLLIEESIKYGKTVVLPKVNGQELEFYIIKDLDNNDFEKSKIGVEEPNPFCHEKLDIRLIDLVIVPGICFDIEGNRIGFGKGYYDRLLNKIKNIVSIGICFREQIVQEKVIPVNSFDKKVDLVISD